MDLHSLTAISPVDGRYQSQTKELKNYFSEYALIRYRVLVEIEYFIALCQLPLPQLSTFSIESFHSIRMIYTDFSFEDAIRVKEIEKTTNHDVKAVEYFIKEKFAQLGLEPDSEFVHFGLTSQDINNTAVPLSLKEAVTQLYLPAIQKILDSLSHFVKEWDSVPMLARTHGQPASPTRLGKEIEVFAVRIQEQINLITQLPYAAKFGGASGNMNAHYAAYPLINWHQFAQTFVQEQLKLLRSYPTTQIEHYDYLSAFFDNCKRINTILIDLCRDLWSYIGMGYFHQKIKQGEVGSSAMPHKVNPIDFENAEGNLGIANALFIHLASTLPISRLQRDLTDSTVLRNIGVPFAHSLIAFSSLTKGLDKLILNKSALDADLSNNWAVVAEGIQTILRRERYPQPYEALKTLTRSNQHITKEDIQYFINNLDLSDSVKEELRGLSPHNYVGR
ncbi:MAG: adenylosuccinate lyase [Prevotellaceae bacterium]|jgi:adenylosuccinate lyase|nr:adenylosuccinate lyase [Prevotellaceae bacterium]